MTRDEIKKELEGWNTGGYATTAYERALLQFCNALVAELEAVEQQRENSAQYSLEMIEKHADVAERFVPDAFVIEVRWFHEVQPTWQARVAESETTPARQVCSVVDERDTFEAWAQLNSYNIEFFDYWGEKGHPTRYNANSTEEAWKVWQARAAQSEAKPELRPITKKIILQAINARCQSSLCAGVKNMPANEKQFMATEIKAAIEALSLNGKKD